MVDDVKSGNPIRLLTYGNSILGGYLYENSEVRGGERRGGARRGAERN